MKLNDETDFEPDHVSSQTDLVLNELQLFGYRRFDDEPDPRPLPDADCLVGATNDMFDALISSLGDTRLEPDLSNLLWSLVNLFHRAAELTLKELDVNEQAQSRSQREQDGSEVKSWELERLIREGISLIERRDAFEMMRDQAAEHFSGFTGDAWMPRAGSKANRQALTSAIIDSRDFINQQRTASAEVLIPKGTRIALSGGQDYTDYNAVWSALDRVLAKYPDMVLLHGGSPKGAELFAAKWAVARKVTQITFKPDWGRFPKAAPYKRNDALLASLPVGLLIFRGPSIQSNGIQDNIADSARKVGITVWKAGST